MSGAPVPAERFTAPTPGGIRGLGVGIAALEAVGTGWAVWALHDAPGLLVATLVPLAVGALVAVALIVCRIEVTVADAFAVFAFRPLHRAVVDTADVAAVELVDRVDPARLGGVGLRRMPGKVTGLLWGPGPGVEVRTTRGERIVVVVPAARELHDALDSARARHA
ncbi:hypothetical protein AAG589_06055 [Isoptericola sp. F-RaC21]|uniref:hypothetical protein n=1 Tax=Isoptericola sp. F-RaC21 TaxID=3141452 RepID=UPI00315C012C